MSVLGSGPSGNVHRLGHCGILTISKYEAAAPEQRNQILHGKVMVCFENSCRVNKVLIRPYEHSEEVLCDYHESIEHLCTLTLGINSEICIKGYLAFSLHTSPIPYRLLICSKGNMKSIDGSFPVSIPPKSDTVVPWSESWPLSRRCRMYLLRG